MPTLDAATLMMVIAVVDAFACVVWLLLGHLLRIAPRASRRVALYHGLLAIAWWPGVASLLPPALLAALPVALPEVETAVLLPISTIALGALAAGVRGLMRLQYRIPDIVIVVALGLLGLAVVHPDPVAARVVANVCAGTLALMATRDILIGTGFRTGLTGLLVLPYVVLAIGGLWRAGALVGWLPAGVGMAGATTNAPLALLRLVLNLGIATGLVALVMQRLIARVRHLTRRDALTGLFNRRAIEEHLVRLQAQVDRGRTHAVLVMDVDHFKRINDELGHAGGDAALRHLAALLNEALRDTDCFGRLGGEEFAVLMTDTDLNGAALVAERLRQLLQGRPLAWGDKIWPISASFGVATMRRGDTHGKAALARADAAMYAAKARGRNRVLRADEDEAHA